MGSKMKLRPKRPKQPKQTPLADLEVTMEAREVFAKAFVGSGGLEGLITWIKLNSTNRGMFYAHFAKTLPLSVVSQVTAKITVEDETSIRDAMVDGLARVIESARQDYERAGLVQLNGITYRKMDDGSLVPTDERPDIPVGIIIDNTGTIIDNDPQPVQPPTPDRSASAAAPQAPVEKSAPTVAKTEPSNIVNLNRGGPMLPGLCAGAAVEGLNAGKTTTELFYEWNGHSAHGKPP
jgi:hypothetical protein